MDIYKYISYTYIHHLTIIRYTTIVYQAVIYHKCLHKYVKQFADIHKLLHLKGIWVLAGELSV